MGILIIQVKLLNFRTQSNKQAKRQNCHPAAKKETKY